MKNYFVLLALVVSPTLAFAQASDQPVKVQEGKTASGHPSFKASETVSGQATVLAVNKTTRMVTLLGEKGDTVDVTCGPQVKNFAKIAKGDVVKVKYTETLMIHVEAEGAALKASVESSASSAKPGENPHASMTDKVTFSGTITAIDMAKGSVTLRGAEGNELILYPRVKANLKKVKVGENVVFNYTETVALSVEKVAAK